MYFKILIVNDSPVLTEIIRAVVQSNEIYSVIGNATNGKEAIKMVTQLHPDLVLMDIHMPIMGGVEAIKRIIAARAHTKILITTATISRNMTHIFDGLQYGAMDFAHSPALTQTPGSTVTVAELRQAGRSMLTKIRNILEGRTKKVPALPPQKHKSQRPIQNNTISVVSNIKNRISSQKKYVALGCSTGGPNTLVILLSYLPKPIDYPIVICQHIDEEFSPEFARWLAEQTNLPIKIARNNEELMPGQIYTILGGNRNATITAGGRLVYTGTEKSQIYFPNIDTLFDSMAKNLKQNGCGVVLTGLGSDGSKGLAAINNAGGGAFVQSSTSAMAPSMPLAARDLARLSFGFDLPQLATMIKGWTQKVASK